MKIRWEFKIEDFWVGVFWKQDFHYTLHIWVCIIPCFPIHFTIDNTRKAARELAKMIMMRQELPNA